SATVIAASPIPASTNTNRLPSSPPRLYVSRFKLFVTVCDVAGWVFKIYAWIGCNSEKFGRLYAAAPTWPKNTVIVSSILGGVSDNTGSGIAQRLVIKTGLNVILACNIPKNSPMSEVNAEKKLVEKLMSLGYTRPKSS
ncbi:uncharacterized protein LOC116146825, partial [Pistacia vera]|uniref:uncharacterized protein LOC116146825 n=1 Tax=Pistacia vera TaxID=55513 RepID=UPI001262DA8A